MLSEAQRSELDPYIRRLPVARSRSLLTGTSRSLKRLFFFFFWKNLNLRFTVQKKQAEQTGA